MRDTIEAPPATPPRYSLLIAAPTIDDGAHWVAGVRFAPEGCSGGGRVAVDCNGSTQPLDPDDNAEFVTADAFGVWASDVCSTIGSPGRDFEGRARRQLAAIESFEIAEEVWGGSLVGDPILSGATEVNANVPLTALTSDRLTAAGATPVDALADVVGALGNCGKGRQGMVHMTPQMLQQLITNGSVYRDSGLWYTAMGHLVVADDGYDGSGPGGTPASTTQWIYGTSMMRVRLGAVEVIRTDSEVVTPSTNLVTVFAQRAAAVLWDQCCHVAAEVAVPVPVVGGDS